MQSLSLVFEHRIIGDPGTCNAIRLQFIDEIKSFPTTIVLDGQHKIKKVHTGFYGPGTGSYYQKFTEEFYMLLDKITE